MLQVNILHLVCTIAFVARNLSVEVDLLAKLAVGMDPEDGPIWVCRPDHPDGVMPFTTYSVVSLMTFFADHVR